MFRRPFLLAGLATLAGAFLRLWQLTTVPAGLHYDLAATALLGNEVAFKGFYPVFITAYTGHEVGFYYWLALWFNLMGSSIFTLRLAAALVGVLTLPATFFALRQLLRHETQGPLLAAWGTVFLAFAFFHVAFSRFGFRVITEPLLQALALGFLVRGLHRQTRQKQLVDLALAGLFTGLTAYTYLAARLFPVPLAVFWLVVLLTAVNSKTKIVNSKQWSPFTVHCSLFTLFSATALLAFAPLGLYFIQHPEDFFNRANQLLPGSDQTALVWQGVQAAAGMIFWQGETYDRYNLPGLPLLYPVLGLFFVVGWGQTVVAAFRTKPNVGRAAEWLMLAWLPLMLLPTALAVKEIFPSTIRALGVVPVLFVFPARGAVGVYRWGQRFWPGPLLPVAHPLSWLAAAVLGLGTVYTFNTYFNDWAKLPTQALNNDADLTEIAAFANARDLTATNTYVTALHYRHPTLAYLARDFAQFRWLTGGHSLVIPAQGPTHYFVAASAPLPAEWVAGWAAHAPPTDSALFQAYSFAEGETPPLPAFTPLHENFGNVVFLTGYQTLTTPENLFVDLQLRVENVPAVGDVLPYVRLYDAWGHVWGQSGGFSYPSEQWQAGDVILVRLTVPLPPGLPPGAYAVRAGFYAAGSAWNVPHLAANGAYAGERADVGVVHIENVAPVAIAAYTAQTSLTAPEGGAVNLDALTLLGYGLERAALRQGERLGLTLHWHATAPLSMQTYTITLGGQPIYVGEPVRGTWPFAQFWAGQLVEDRLPAQVPPDFPGGPAALALHLAGHAPLSLTTINVRALARQFTPPAGTWAAPEAVFNGQIRLVGHQWAAGRLTVLWQALAPLPAEYVIFAHVYDAQGALLTQRDAAPQTYPTSLWQPGEYLTDTFDFGPLPEAARVAVGFYLPETGERLPVGEADFVAWGVGE